MAFLAHGVTNFMLTHCFYKHVFLIGKNVLKNSTNCDFFGPWANKLCAHLFKKIIRPILEKNM
jgi:hypothetical protein